MQQIIEALVAGAAIGSSDAAAATVRSATADAYTGLRDLVVGRLAGRPGAGAALDEVERQAAGGEQQVDDGWREVLARELERAGVGDDDEVRTAASRLLAQLGEPEAGMQVHHYDVDGRGSHGMIVGGSRHEITQVHGDRRGSG